MKIEILVGSLNEFGMRIEIFDRTFFCNFFLYNLILMITCKICKTWPRIEPLSLKLELKNSKFLILVLKKVRIIFLQICFFEKYDAIYLSWVAQNHSFLHSQINMKEFHRYEVVSRK